MLLTSCTRIDFGYPLPAPIDSTLWAKDNFQAKTAWRLYDVLKLVRFDDAKAAEPWSYYCLVVLEGHFGYPLRCQIDSTRGQNINFHA